MKRSLVICLLVCSSLVGLGSAIRCYSCTDYTASCGKQKDCRYEDACLTLTERGGKTYRQCLKYSDCEKNYLSQQFPKVNLPSLGQKLVLVWPSLVLVWPRLVLVWPRLVLV
uniref:CD59 glycoprotein-like n=1 Tax=Cyprinodon variegatus TaxID=28743 RepID=A0A3Q2EGB9_CYPVA